MYFNNFLFVIRSLTSYQTGENSHPYILFKTANWKLWKLCMKSTVGKLEYPKAGHVANPSVTALYTATTQPLLPN